VGGKGRKVYSGVGATHRPGIGSDWDGPKAFKRFGLSLLRFPNRSIRWNLLESYCLGVVVKGGKWRRDIREDPRVRNKKQEV